MEVDDARRRQGLARALLGAVADWAWRRGARAIYLQVGERNAAARTLYEAAGFRHHHAYAYLVPPA